MRLRHPVLIKSFALAGACVLRLWMGSVRYRYYPLTEDLSPGRRDLPGRYIYAIWHENILMPVYQYSKENVWVLISQHRDGQLLTEMGRHLRLRLVRGSTTRGGVRAVRELLRVGERAHLAITPDGPRGPRRFVQEGLVYLAARTGLQIVPTAFGYHKPWRLRSWDHFAVPRPWSRATCVTGAPIAVPGEADKAQLANYRQLVEERLLQVTELAERWAETGKLILSLPTVAQAPGPLVSYLRTSV
jgi:lysophospholipid acyltransferase (LPLAT)-like uncharacterized protein